MEQALLFPNCVKIRQDRPVNVASVPQRSPFRYPGGKTWLVPLVRKWMKSRSCMPEVLVEPFAGGGIIGLTVAFERLANRVVMVEMDDNVAAVWETILGGGASWLADRILEFNLTLERVRAEVSRVPRSRRELAFQTLLRNRTSHGGILAEGAGVLKNGENGRGIHSRWYPKTLAERIRSIELVSNRIEFLMADAFDVIPKFSRDEHAVFFIDPPYTAGGKRAGSRLYTHYSIDHERLFSVCEQVRGDVLLTYDNAEEVAALARKHGFETRPVCMKNTHHSEMTELLVGRNLGWVRQ